MLNKIYNYIFLKIGFKEVYLVVSLIAEVEFLGFLGKR